MSKNLYLTTTTPYVNDNPHIGFALEIIEADTIARFNRLIGREVFFSTGTDEHGLKIYKKAEEEGIGVEDYVNKYSERFAALKDHLNLSYDNFIRTTNKEHIEAAKEFWKKCDQKGDIYKKKYKGLYCVGCERFIKKDELVDGCCSNHPNTDLQELEEENYFFKFSNYKKELLEYLKSETVILPDWRREEAIKFVEDGLEDFSISRVKEKMPWGISVPGDESQVMYVWFDALINYISTLGWPEGENFQKFWENGETLQLAGKDQIRFQSLMWQAMLMSAGIKNTDKIIYHGFITSGGKKMSKSIGNVINPIDLVKEYNTDSLRYFLLRHIHPYEDSDFTMEAFKELYNGNLANSLGNLVSRVVKMIDNYDVKVAHDNEDKEIAKSEDLEEWRSLFNQYQFSEVANHIWSEIAGLEKYISETEPYKLIKTEEEKAKEIIAYLAIRLWDISVMLSPLMPETSDKIKESLINRKVEKALFERKE